MPGNQYPSGMCWDNTAHDGIIPENLKEESQEKGEKVYKEKNQEGWKIRIQDNAH